MPSRWSDRRERFRSIIAGDRCVHPASVFDPISARIAEDLGFEAGMFAGSVASLAVLGAPDNISITLTEFAEQAHRICRAGDLAVMVDADHGYGNALSVMRTVEELETAGICALTIEDTLLPQPYGGGKTRLIPVDEGIGKLKAAVAARRDPALVIAGRTSAAAVTGLDDAVARVKAYSATGVDAIFLAGIKTIDEIEAIRAATRLPILLGGVPAPLMDRERLAAKGVRICLQGHQPIMAAAQAVYTTMKALREGTEPAKLAGIASGDLMGRVTRAADYKHWEAEFLGGSGPK
ncbi:MAG: oxaloacetate decarboxylase [Hyphomicrobiaceae bacterium]